MPRLAPSMLDDVRARIEAAALALFVERGFAATTTRDIATAAGLTPGALYVHYPGKEALFAAIVRRYQARLASDRGPLLRYFARSRFPHDITAMARAVRAAVRANRSFWLLWYIDVLEFRGRHFKRGLDLSFLRDHPALVARFAELRRNKTLRIDPERAFVMIYLHLFNYFLLENIFGGHRLYGLPEARAIESIGDVFLQGILDPRHARAAGTARARPRARPSKNA